MTHCAVVVWSGAVMSWGVMVREAPLRQTADQIASDGMPPVSIAKVKLPVADAEEHLGRSFDPPFSDRS
jgi:hypothetical protein